MDILAVRDALLTVLDRVYHYQAPRQGAGDAYAVWGETAAEIKVFADNKARYKAASGEIWFYTSLEYDPRYDAIIRALDDGRIAIQLGEIGRDPDTGRIAYKILWEVNVGESDFYRAPAD